MVACAALLLGWSAQAIAKRLSDAAIRATIVRHLNADPAYPVGGIGQYFPERLKWRIELGKVDASGHMRYRATLKTPFVSAHVPLLTQFSNRIYVVSGPEAVLKGQDRIRDEDQRRYIGLSPAGAAYATAHNGARLNKRAEAKYWALRSGEIAKDFITAFRRVNFNKWMADGMKPLVLE